MMYGMKKWGMVGIVFALNTNYARCLYLVVDSKIIFTPSVILFISYDF